MKGSKKIKSALIILLCTLTLIFAFVVSAENSERWINEETTGMFPEKHEHIYGDWVIPEGKNPTCTTTGERVKKCLFTDGINYCDKVYTEVLPVNPDAHVRGSVVNVIKEATCSSVGESTFKCAEEGCNKTVTVYTERTEHVFDETKWTETKPVHGENTPELPGTKTNRCTVCFTYVEITIPVEHDYKTEGTVTTPATCTSKGTKLVYCTTCKKPKEVEIDIDPENHVYSGKAYPIGDVDCINGGRGIVSCEACKKIAYVDIPAEKAHDYLEWEYTAPTGDCQNGAGRLTKKCNVSTCTEVFDTIEWYAHELDENARTHLATCSDYGYIKGNCTVCKATDVRVYLPVDENAHSWIEEVLVEPTCTSEGYVFRICEYDSSHTEYTKIPKAEHCFVTEWEVSKVATCTKEGEITNVCVTCQQLVTRSTEVDLNNHPSVKNWVPEDSDISICVAPGKEIGYCVDCEAAYGEGNVSREIPMHTGEGRIEISRTEPNCRNEGIITYECLGCGFKYNETIPANIFVHQPGREYYITKNATCSETGMLSKLCDFCMTPIIADEGEHKQKEIPKTNHIMTEWEIAKEPTCQEDGTKVRTCTVCGEKQETAVSGTHRYQSWVVDDTYQAATCSVQGRRTRGCYNCDAVEEDYYTLPHEPGDWYLVKGSCEEGGIFRKKCKTCSYVAEQKSVGPGEHIELIEGDIKYAVSESVCSSKLYTCTFCKAEIEATSRHIFQAYTHLESYADLHDVCDDETCKKEHKAQGGKNYHVVCTDMDCKKYHTPSTESCENNGWTEKYFCLTCKYVVEQKYVAAYGHNFEYDEEGTEYCLNCGLYYIEGGETCDHFCHNNGTIAKVLTKVMTFFWKIFDKFSVEPKNQYCKCGMPHYELDK